MNNLQHSCASRVHSLWATSKYIQKFAEAECRHFDKIFITDCTGRQLPVQPVMKISSKWYFRFSARAGWIILTFRADLVHVYIAWCDHVYSYKKNTRPLCRPISFDFLHVSLYWILRVTYISYANSQVSLLPLLPVYGVSNGLLFGISGYRWIEILISLNHDISKSRYPISENQISEPAGACGLGPVWYQGIGIHHGGRWQPAVPKQFRLGN